MFSSRKLRHRITIQRLSDPEDQDSFGDPSPVNWETFAEVWAEIAPISAREFVAADAEQSKVIARMTIRGLPGVDPTMRILHNGKYYNIEGILWDKDSGLEYITLPVSEGVRVE